MVSCEFNQCRAQQRCGGAVSCSRGELRATTCTFLQCSAPYAGAIYMGGVYSRTSTLTNCSITNCSASRSSIVETQCRPPSAITCWFNGSTISGCWAAMGLIYIREQCASTYRMTDVKFIENTVNVALTMGMVGIRVRDQIIYEKCTFISNVHSKGGFVNVSGGDRSGIILKDCEFKHTKPEALTTCIISVTTSDVIPRIELIHTTFTQIHLAKTFVVYKDLNMRCTCETLKITDCEFDQCMVRKSWLPQPWLLAKCQSIQINDSVMAFSCDAADMTPLRIEAWENQRLTVDIRGTTFEPGRNGWVKCPLMIIAGSDRGTQVNFYNCCFAADSNAKAETNGTLYMDLTGFGEVTCTDVCFELLGNMKPVTCSGKISFSCPDSALSGECECWYIPPSETSAPEEETTEIEMEAPDVVTSDEEDGDVGGGTENAPVGPTEKPVDPPGKPDETVTGSGESGQREDPKSNAGLIAGVTIGVIIVIAVVVVLVFFLLRRRKNFDTDSSPTEPETVNTD